MMTAALLGLQENGKQSRQPWIDKGGVYTLKLEKVLKQLKDK